MPSRFRGYKLSKEQVIAIFTDSGFYKDIAARHGVHPTTARHIKEGYYHIHITGDLEPGEINRRGRPKKQHKGSDNAA